MTWDVSVHPKIPHRSRVINPTGALLLVVDLFSNMAFVNLPRTLSPSLHRMPVLLSMFRCCWPSSRLDVCSHKGIVRLGSFGNGFWSWSKLLPRRKGVSLCTTATNQRGCEPACLCQERRGSPVGLALQNSAYKNALCHARRQRLAISS